MTGLSDEAERRAFVYWLRTGRRHAPGLLAVAEHKFNPWHDPTNGQFTSGDGGGGSRFTGGRGDFGGGGAQSSWDGPKAPKSRDKPVRSKPVQRFDTAPHKLLRTLPFLARRPGTGEHSVLHRNGYQFEIDSQHRTVESTGTITLGHASARSRLQQARAGGADRRPSDDGGHFIAHRFNGPGDAFNHFAQNAGFNRGEDRAIEDGWARSTRQGKAVFVRIRAHYRGASRRPDSLKVQWTIDDHTWVRIFPN